MITKEDCLRMLNSIEQNAYNVYIIPDMFKVANKTVIINNEKVKLKCENMIPECVEYLKNMLGE